MIDGRTWAYFPYKVAWNILDLIYPPVCAGCGKPGTRWCETCQEELISIPEPMCEICGTPQRIEGTCLSCSHSRPSFYSLRSWVVFDGPIRNAIHRLKYRRDLGLGDALSIHVKRFLQQLTWQFDLIVPIPLSKQRMKERGYNQIALVAQPLAMQMRVDYSPRSLIRVKHTLSQVGLSAAQRKNNVEGAFSVEGKQVSGKTILLMDDVATTGSTLISASKALVDSGASKVYALTLARALSHHGLHIA